MPNDGFAKLLRVMRNESEKQINKQTGYNTLDVGEIKSDGSLFISSTNATLKKGNYLINKSLLEHECEFEGEGVTSVKVKNQLEPGGSYLVAYLNTVPTVLCQLTRGE